MKKGTIFLIALTWLTVMSAQSVSAQIRVSVNQPVVEVQNTVSGFVLGSLSDSQTFTIICISNRAPRPDWAYGNAHGHTQRTGWVLLSDLTLPANHPRLSDCGKEGHHSIAQKKFMRSVVVNNVRRYDKNSRTCQKGVDGPFSGEATCDGSPTGVADGTEYCRNFNFRTGARRDCEVLHNVVPGAPPGAPIEVKWRYVTVRGNYVVVRRGARLTSRLGVQLALTMTGPADSRTLQQLW